MVTSSSNSLNIGNLITCIEAPISPANKRIIMGSIIQIRLAFLSCLKKDEAVFSI